MGRRAWQWHSHKERLKYSLDNLGEEVKVWKIHPPIHPNGTLPPNTLLHLTVHAVDMLDFWPLLLLRGCIWHILCQTPHMLMGYLFFGHITAMGTDTSQPQLCWTFLFAWELLCHHYTKLLQKPIYAFCCMCQSGSVRELAPYVTTFDQWRMELVDKYASLLSFRKTVL